MQVLENHATILANSDEPLPKVFQNFVRAVKAGNFHEESLLENKQPEKRCFWDFMKKYNSFSSFSLSMLDNSTGSYSRESRVTGGELVWQRYSD